MKKANYNNLVDGLNALEYILDLYYREPSNQEYQDEVDLTLETFLRCIKNILWDETPRGMRKPEQYDPALLNDLADID